VDANLVWHTEGRLSVVVHGRRGPTTLEWDRYLNHIRENVRIKNLRVLRCFAPEEFALACAYLGLNALERDQGAHQLAALQSKVV
jgi:hypothetical protein